MHDQIRSGLDRNFRKHRLVVWQDPEERFRTEFDAVEIAGVYKLEVENNEFALKHRVLIEEPGTAFLIYRPGAVPPDEQNWLLDIELGHGLFQADKADLVRGELNLPPRFTEMVRAHLPFFSSRRTEQLKQEIEKNSNEGEREIRARMIAIAAGAPGGGMDAILEALFSELAAGKDTGWTLIRRSGLEEFFWKAVAERYEYDSEEPDLEDFARAIFEGCYNMAFDAPAGVNTEAQVFLNRWSGMRGARTAFETLSDRYAAELGVAADLERRPFDRLAGLFIFRDIDAAIVDILARRITQQDIPQEDVGRIVQERRSSPWYEEFEAVYEALLCGAALQAGIENLHIPDMDLESGLNVYASTWFRIDQLYRKFVLHSGRTMHRDLIDALVERVENLYTNLFLPRLNEAWQRAVDDAERWQAQDVVSQRRFYERHVAPLRARGSKVVVIVSDALRYEIGEEFHRRIKTLPRFSARLDMMLGAIPSYTQLGMAALLPNRDLRVTPDADARVDHESAAGTERRAGILSRRADAGQTCALQADALESMGKDEMRALIRDHDVIYIYHNVIDAAGDKAATEGETCAAAERALDQLEKIVRRLSGNNASNMIVTADHGFLYQARPIHEGDFSQAQVDGDAVTFRHRRFLLGHDLEAGDGLAHFTPSRAGLEGDADILIPRSITRLRRQGSGTRFVHGGASLQEVVVPVISINKTRKDDIEEVSVEILGSGSRTITTGQHTVRLYQAQPATEKRKPLKLRIGFTALDGTPISNIVERIFDSASPDARERESSVRFLLSRQAEAYNDQDIRLELVRADHKGVGDGLYKSETFRYRRAFGGDFDL